MTDEKKQEFTLKITRANRTGLTVIVYEIALEYIQEAIEYGQSKETEQYIRAIRNASACMEKLKETLDFSYAVSGTLLHFYISIKKQMAKAIASLRTEDLELVIYGIEEMKRAFEEVAAQDDSAPFYENREEISAGYTYGKSGVNVNPNAGSASRGFLA